jgi:murein DD-endopeptidase MepM/ murein hydrolase activator NlpD
MMCIVWKGWHVARGRGGFPEDNGNYDGDYGDEGWRDDSREDRADGRRFGGRGRHTVPLADGYDDYGDGYEHGGALISYDEMGNRLPATIQDDTGPVIISGGGVSMGEPFIKRRERPLSMRLTIFALMACILVTGLFAITPLGANASNSITSFQAISGAIVLNKEPAYFWYTVTWGDTIESIATKFGVEVGGIYEMNNLLAGQEISVGIAYKIPQDKTYGKDYRPLSFVGGGSASGTTTFGNSPWTSIAGDPAPGSEVVCAPNGNGNPAGYQLHSPNWGAYWVRGFTWYHNGVDLAANEGNPIHAAQSGQVIWAGWDVGGLGWSVKVNHCNHVSTVYGHMMKLEVTVGQTVLAGDVVGLEGSTGWSTGPHLHYMVEWNNQPVDPMPYYGYNTYNITHNV